MSTLICDPVNMTKANTPSDLTDAIIQVNGAEPNVQAH